MDDMDLEDIPYSKGQRLPATRMVPVHQSSHATWCNQRLFATLDMAMQPPLSVPSIFFALLCFGGECGGATSRMVNSYRHHLISAADFFVFLPERLNCHSTKEPSMNEEMK